jgi:uncharacterized protein
MSPTQFSQLDETLLAKRKLLTEQLARMQSVLVAYSGGVDSSVLAYYARQVLGPKAKIVIALSPSLAQSELDAARHQARQFDFDLIEINTDEVGLDAYRRNDGMRCFFCKSTLFEHLHQIKEELSINAIAYGANMDDLSDERPGHKAAAKYNVEAPLLQCGLYKTEIRALAEAAGLPSFDRPQAACLSSRFPKNVYIDPARLAIVDRAEEAVRALGFKQVRVRYRLGDATRRQTGVQKYDGTIPFLDADHRVSASVEIGEEELLALKQHPEKAALIEEKLTAIGFDSVHIDEHGYRQGGADKHVTVSPASAGVFVEISAGALDDDTSGGAGHG